MNHTGFGSTWTEGEKTTFLFLVVLPGWFLAFFCCVILPLTMCILLVGTFFRDHRLEAQRLKDFDLC